MLDYSITNSLVLVFLKAFNSDLRYNKLGLSLGLVMGQHQMHRVVDIHSGSNVWLEFNHILQGCLFIGLLITIQWLANLITQLIVLFILIQYKSGVVVIAVVFASHSYSR